MNVSLLPRTPLSPRPSTAAVWLSAMRPATLPASVAPLLVGNSLVLREPSWSPTLALASMACALLLQLGSNLANDAADFQRGADGPQRLGPPRATQHGWLTSKQVYCATALVLSAALALGLTLAAAGGWPILVAGVAALVCALAYTTGPYPLAYLGLGELFVFVFFGLVAVVGSAYLHTLQVSVNTLLAAVPMGLLAAAILLVNNIRDHVGDALAKKRTLAVRFGTGFSRRLYAGFLSGAFGCCVLAAFAGLGWGWLLPLFLAPSAWWLARRVHRAEGAALNPLLGATAKLELGFAVLLSVGVLL